jgi:hypothetical protein
MAEIPAMRRGALIVGSCLGAIVLGAFAVAAANGVLFIPGITSKYGPPKPWSVVPLDTVLARLLAVAVFSGGAGLLVRVAHRARKQHRNEGRR